MPPSRAPARATSQPTHPLAKGAPREARGHTGEVLEKKHLCTRLGGFAPQGRVRIKCWHMFEGYSDRGTDLPISDLAFRRQSRSHACARGERKISGWADPHASWGRRNAALSPPHRQRAAPLSSQIFGDSEWGGTGGRLGGLVCRTAAAADREWGGHRSSNMIGLQGVPHSAPVPCFLTSHVTLCSF